MLLISFLNFPCDAHVPSGRKDPSPIEHLLLSRSWRQRTAQTLLECVCELPFLDQSQVEVNVGAPQELKDRKTALVLIDDLTGGQCQLLPAQLRSVVEKAGRAAAVWIHRSDWRVLAVSRVGTPQMPDVRREFTFDIEPGKQRPRIVSSHQS